MDNPLVKNYVKRFPHHNIEASDRGTVIKFSSLERGGGIFSKGGGGGILEIALKHLNAEELHNI